MDMPALLDVRNLTTSFHTRDGEVQAVRDVSFSVHPGEALGVVGESGSGKSVTFLSVLGLLAETGRVKGGEALFKGRDLLKAGRRELRGVRGNEISMVFQDPMSSLNPLKTVGKQVAESLELHSSLGRAEIKKATLRMLDLVRIPDAAKRYGSYPHEFSGGMRQRVMIAMALVCGPALVVADEPTTALDVTIQDQVLTLLGDLRRESGSAIVFISHDLAVIASACQRVIVMYGGMIMEEASVGELFGSPSHPYTVGLLRSIPSLDRDTDASLEPIPGSPPDMLAPPAGCPFAPRCVHARAVCLSAVPPLRAVSPTHRSRCWLWADEAPAYDNPFKEGGRHA